MNTSTFHFIFDESGDWAIVLKSDDPTVDLLKLAEYLYDCKRKRLKSVEKSFGCL